MDAAKSKLTLPVKLSYSLGWPVEGIVLLSFEMFILFYYTQVIGLSGTLTGIALFIAMAVDAIADPLIGSFSDNLRKTLWGRRHTLMILAAVPLGAAFALVFLPPSGMGQLGIFAWLTVTAIVTRMAAGFFIIPYSALNAELTREAGTRASLGVYKSVMQTAFILLLVTSAFQYFFAATPEFAQGQANPEAYRPFALTWSAVLVVIILVCSAGTYGLARRIENASTLGASEPFSYRTLIGNWRSALVRNRNVRWILLGATAMTLTSGMVRTLNSHISIYFWEMRPSQIAQIQQISVPGMLVGLLLARMLLRRLETLTLLMIGMSLSYAGFVVLPLLRLMNLLPGNGDPLIYTLLLTGSAVAGIGLGFLSLMSGLICAEAADEDEYLFGKPQQGMLFGFIFLATKLGSACGKLGAGMAIDFVRFPVGSAIGTVGPGPVRDLGIALVATVLIFGALSFALWSRYDLRRKRHEEIVRTMADKGEIPPETLGAEGPAAVPA